MSGAPRTTFFIDGSARARPASRRTIYCDGGIDERFSAHDVELSHWIPNRTPRAYKANTSTEICLNFVANDANRAQYDLVVNNHIDVDGILSVFVAVSGAATLAHRRLLVQAAEMGDFWGWGEPDAQTLFQALTLLKNRLIAARTDPNDIYARAFECVDAILAGESRAETLDGIAALQASVALIEAGRVGRTLINSRFVHYAIPQALAAQHLAQCLTVPGFNAPLSDQCLLLPQARARLDCERVQLLSVETRNGWYYDLWYPGYVWADTPDLWRAPGLVGTNDSNVHLLNHAPLRGAAAALDRLERGHGEWTIAPKLSPFTGLTGRGFPIVLSFLAGGAPAPSALQPAVVLEHLERAFHPVEAR